MYLRKKLQKTETYNGLKYVLQILKNTGAEKLDLPQKLYTPCPRFPMINLCAFVNSYTY